MLFKCFIPYLNSINLNTHSSTVRIGNKKKWLSNRVFNKSDVVVSDTKRSISLINNVVKVDDPNIMQKIYVLFLKISLLSRSFLEYPVCFKNIR